MATAPFNIAETTPADDANVSAFPAAERTYRDVVESALAIEHDMGNASSGKTARHKFGVGNNAARDAITDWVVGSIWINTSTSPATLQRVVSVGPVVWENVNAHNPGYALLASANTFTAAQTVSIATGTTTLTMVTADPGNIGPTLVTEHNSASPAAADLPWRHVINARDSIGNSITLGQARMVYDDPTDTTEDAHWEFVTTQNAGGAVRLSIGAGTWTQGATGGDPGVGKINAQDYQRNGVEAAGFERQLFHAQQQHASGTAGGGQASGSYATRTLNTVVTNEIAGVTLSSNQITDLPAGTYYIDAVGMFGACDRCKMKLRNITDSADVIIGLTADAGAGLDNNPAPLFGRFTLAATKTLAIQTRVGTSNTTNGWGAAASFGDTEIYLDVKIWKIG